MVNAIEQGIQFLIAFGLFDVILPFLLFFTICFGLLQRTKIFGDDSRKYNLMIALTFGFFTIYQLQLTEKLPLFLARVGLLFVVVVVIMILAGLLGVQKEYAGNTVMLILLAYLVYNIIEIFFSFSIIWNFFGRYINLGIIAPLFTALFVFFAIIWFVTRGSGSGSSGKTQGTEEKAAKEKNTDTSAAPEEKAPKRKYDYQKTPQEELEKRGAKRVGKF